MIHHSYVTCDDCGKRHYPGNQSECIEQLRLQIADGTAEIERLQRELAMCKGQMDRMGENAILRNEELDDKDAELKKLRKLAEMVKGIAGVMETFGFTNPPDGKAWENIVAKASEAAKLEMGTKL